MANVLNGNTFKVDTAHTTDSDDLIRKQALVVYIVVRATGANGRIVLSDVGTNPDQKIDLSIPVSGVTEIYPFEACPLIFPNGVRVAVLSNAVATIVLRNPGG